MAAIGIAAFVLVCRLFPVVVVEAPGRRDEPRGLVRAAGSGH